METITYKADTKTIQEIVHYFGAGMLNLEPGFQRESVWTLSDRRKLIDSILRTYPLPSIFIYKREEDGELIYDVLDGKQRIESILMFMGEMRGYRFDTKSQFHDMEKPEWVDWNYLRRKKQQSHFTGYELQTIEVSGNASDIIELFVRINSTGKALTKQERRKAKYYKCQFLKRASQIAKRYERYFLSLGIFSRNEISRQKHIELVCELIVSADHGDVVASKTMLDKVMEKDSIRGRELDKAAAATVSALNRVKRMFKELKSTRLFKQHSDFYTLAALVQKFEKERLILSDPKRNRLARDLLAAFASKVDEVRELQKRVKGIKSEHELYRDYLITTQHQTDSFGQRKKREQILSGLLESIFIRKDSERIFSPEQRRILWNMASERKCEKCHRKLKWEDFTVDHIHPWTKGGRTELENAALMCRNCNSSKGSKRR